MRDQSRHGVFVYDVRRYVPERHPGGDEVGNLLGHEGCEAHDGRRTSDRFETVREPGQIGKNQGSVAHAGKVRQSLRPHSGGFVDQDDSSGSDLEGQLAPGHKHGPLSTLPQGGQDGLQQPGLARARRPEQGEERRSFGEGAQHGLPRLAPTGVLYRFIPSSFGCGHPIMEVRHCPLNAKGT